MILSSAFAADWGPPDKFVITIKSLALKNNTGQWVTVVEPDKQFDLFNDQAKVTLFNNQGRIPEDEYINFRLVISETVKVQEADQLGNKTKEGGVTILGGTARDNSELPGTITSFTEKAPTWNNEEAGEISATINFDNEDEDDIIEMSKVHDFAKPFVIKRGSFVNVVLAMDLVGTCYKINPGAFKRGSPKKQAMLVFPPRSVSELRFTIDNRTELLQANDVLIKF